MTSPTKSILSHLNNISTHKNNWKKMKIMMPQLQQFNHNPILFQNQPTDQGTDNLSPSNLNRYELYSRSKLRAYLADKNIARKSNHLLIEIQQQLYDPKNKAVVMCNPSLAWHLIRVKKQNWQDNLNRYTNEHTTAATHPAEYLARHIIQLASITNDLFVAQEARFMVKPNLLTILKTDTKSQDRKKEFSDIKKLSFSFQIG